MSGPTVRAKFKVNSIERTLGYANGRTCEVQTIKMSPVYSSEEGTENKKFWDASPSGSLELGCANLEAAKHFELNKEYYIDFTPAPASE